MELKEGKGKDEEKAKMKWETKKMLVEKKCRKKWGEGIMLMKFFTVSSPPYPAGPGHRLFLKVC